MFPSPKIETRYWTNQRSRIINVINKNINSYNFPLVTICSADNTKCELAKIANFTCVKSDDCVQAVLDGNADLAVAKADEMAAHSKFRVLLIVTE